MRHEQIWTEEPWMLAAAKEEFEPGEILLVAHVGSKVLSSGTAVKQMVVDSVMVDLDADPGSVCLLKHDGSYLDRDWPSIAYYMPIERVECLLPGYRIMPMSG